VRAFVPYWEESAAVWAGSRVSEMNRVSYHDACNDLAVAIGSVRAFLDGKLEASRDNLDDVLQSLEHVDTLMAQAQAARPSLPVHPESMLQAIVEGSPYAKVLVDAAGRIVFVNAQTEALFGYAREELLGGAIELLVPQRFRRGHPPLRLAFTAAPSARAMGAGRDLYGRRKDGTEVPIEIGLNPIVTDSGTFTLAAITDITERRRAEELRLEHLGMQEHAAQVEELNRQLQSASQFKSQFVATMSHELRTPLTVIVGAAEFLDRGHLDERQRLHVEAIAESAEALLGLINSILDFSKIEAGKLELNPVNFLVETALDGAAEVSAQLARGKGLTLHTFVDPNIPSLYGDSDRLRQVLLNLLGNAVKFTEHGRVVARASATELGEHVTVRFEVQDTGPGIDADVRARLFEPFIQADASTTRRYGGTGLGLSISRRLVELMGGEIGIASVPGTGACFWFTARFARATRPLIGARTLLGAAGLIVTSDDTFADIVESYMLSWGMRSYRARNAGDFGERRGVHEGTTWFIIADADQIGGPELELAVASARGSTPTHVIDVGSDHPIRKPLRQSTLFDAIARVFGDVREPVIVVAAPRSQPTSGTILIVEDNASLQRLLKLQFDDLGVHVDFASDGLEAIDAVTHGSYVMIFMDCQMPNMDGLTAARTIRALELASGTHLPIVAMTANAFAEDRAACIEAGMDGYLAKPVRLADLRGALERWSPGAQP
jgi:two-component system, sensor histidine kinase and response regulator